MISSNIITEISKAENISWSIVEKDYFLTLLLDAVSASRFLRDNFIFKGGTALRKIYFRHYRYLEDLDFTLKIQLTEKEIREAWESAFEYLKKQYNADFRIRDFYSRKWFSDIKVQFTGLKGVKNTIALDILSDEIIVDTIKEENVFNPYYEKTFTVPVYSMEEILAEKLRSLLQRTRVRDYYDVWYLLTQSGNKINMEKVKGIFIKKVEQKKLSFSSKGQLLDQNKINQAGAYYQRQLGSHLKKLPPFDRLIAELRAAITKLI